MADVAIIHSPDKETVAVRLREAIAGAGYDVRSVDVDRPEGLGEAIGGAAGDARILIWSRPLVSHALHSGELAGIRQLPNLIEVSADGIMPPAGGDAMRVVLISGWRGQPFHPGWQRIHGEIKRLCGARKGPAEAARSSASLPKRRSDDGAGSAAATPTGGRAGRCLIGGAVAILLVGAGAGAAAWIGERALDGTPAQSRGRAETLRAGATPPPPSMLNTGAAPVETQATAAAPIAPPSSTPTPPEAAARAAKRPPRSEPSGHLPATARSRPLRSLDAGPAKRYSPRNSKVMRQFCERNGRSTPQCRIFLRSVRGPGG
jgi:hypothetical protein